MTALPCTRDPEAWFADHAVGVRKAKAICLTECANTAACLAWALEHDETFGVWGGTTVRERRAHPVAPSPLVLRPVRRCTSAGCTGVHHARGLCHGCDMRARRSMRKVA